MGKALETVNRFYDTTENKKGKGLEAMLAGDMTFVGPLMKTAGAEEYINSTRQFLQMHKATRMLKQFENGNDVCSIYEMDIATPAGGTITLELTDWIQVANGKVAKKKSITTRGNLPKHSGWADWSTTSSWQAEYAR